MSRRALLATLLLSALGCALFSGSPPLGPLPHAVRPTHYTLALEIDPAQERFHGDVAIELSLASATRTLWLHGLDLDVEQISVAPAGGEPLAGRWEPQDGSGVSAVRLPRTLGPGAATLRAAWSAPFADGLRGLYRVEVDGAAYAFSQLQPISARRVFPGFDDPAFKTPFEVALVVPADLAAISNAPAVAEETLADGRRRVRFAPTRPLPTYLLAFAVGPFDLVEASPLPPGEAERPPVPLRGVAVRGRGGALAYALEHTPPLLAEVERYFGSPFPYEKLDVIAVPDFAAGAMENAGAITFTDGLLLLDGADAPEEQRRHFAYVMAHELAHSWFGNLVTLRWWDDLWLNEAFATWRGMRTVERVFPEQNADVALLEFVHRAMDADSLVSARAIRQPIETDHDIHNAFDAITYGKGAGVLAMFERWLGAERFRTGVRDYLAVHRDGTAESADLLAALSAAAERDVRAPFESFLTQPGVPFVAAETHCAEDGAELRLRQSRYLPLGSGGDADVVWQIPVCARFAAGGAVQEACILLAEPEGSLGLGTECPDWVLPNAAAAGYYRWSQPLPDGERLRARAWPALSPRERLAFADSLVAAFHAGARPAGEVLPALAELARDGERAVAEAPIGLLREMREHLVPAALRPRVERFAGAIYEPVFRRLGWTARPREDGDTALLRKAVVEALVFTARDSHVRDAAARRGRRLAGIGAPPDRSAAAPDLAEVVLGAAVQTGDAGVFDVLLAQVLASEDPVVRVQRLDALGRAPKGELAERARALALDPRLRVREAFATLWRLSSRLETRDATWSWIERNFDALVARVGAKRAGAIPWMASGFCTEERARAVQAFLGPRIDALDGGPRNLDAALERIRLCAALAAAQGEDSRRFFESSLR